MITDGIEYGSREKIIKRKHYRIGCLWDISCQKCHGDLEPTEGGQWFQAATTDISGGGCRFNSEREFEEDGIIMIKIKNHEKDKEGELLLRGVVIASQLLPNRKGTYETRVKFLEPSFREQEQLIRRIFEEKRKFKWQERGFNNEEKYFSY